MIELKGKYTNAIIYQDPNCVEESCISQIQTLIDSPAYENCKVRVMPDCHTGVSATIGFTSTIINKVIPATVGVDIGCGMLVLKLEGIKKEDIDFKKFDDYIRTYIPSGRSIREVAITKAPYINNLRCFRELKDTPKFEKALGTLGGG